MISKASEVSAAPGDTAVIQPDAVREQLQRVLANPLFRNSRRFSGLLNYIVEKTLAGEHQSLKERIIGIEVFERTTDYDPGTDAIVRVAAAEVRKRLSLYYKEPAREQELRIDVPVRSYKAEFALPVAKPAPQVAGEPALPVAASDSGRRIRGWHWLVALACALAIAGIYRATSTSSALEQFWAPLVDHPDPVAVLVNSQGESAQQIEYRKNDLTAATALISFLGAHGKSSSLRYSQSTAPDSLKGQSVIVVGPILSGWAARSGNALRFQFHADADSRWIEDSADPAHGTWGVDLATPDAARTEYVLITRALDSSTGRWWIGISGVTGNGTALTEALMVDAEAVASLARQLPGNWPEKNLQVVLSVTAVNGRTAMPHVVASHSW